MTPSTTVAVAPIICARMRLTNEIQADRTFLLFFAAADAAPSPGGNSDGGEAPWETLKSSDITQAQLLAAGRTAKAVPRLFRPIAGGISKERWKCPPRATGAARNSAQPYAGRLRRETSTRSPREEDHHPP